MEKTKNLPYFNTYQNMNKSEEKSLKNFLLREFRPKLREIFPQHYLVQAIPSKNLEYIRRKQKTHPYFLRFDIAMYYPSIDHKILLKKIPENFTKLNKKQTSRRFNVFLKKQIPLFLEKSPSSSGLPIGGYLSYPLSGIFLLALDLKIENPFLRQVDDYIIFCKKKKGPERILREKVIPILKELKLEINVKKLKSGKFNQEKVDFLGFEYYAGYFTIKEEKKEAFKKKILQITGLRKKKTRKEILKQTNNKVLGFGHYYKHCSCKKEFKDLDSFVRMRVRRYFSKNRDLKNKKSNLIFTNEVLKNLGLKSLGDIKKSFDSKKTPKSLKKEKKEQKTGKRQMFFKNDYLEEKGHYYEQKLILKELKAITSLLKKKKI